MVLQAWYRDLVRDTNNLLNLLSMSFVHPILLGGHRATWACWTAISILVQ